MRFTPLNYGLTFKSCHWSEEFTFLLAFFHKKSSFFYLAHVVFNVSHECLYDVFIVSKRSSVFVWPLHSDIRVSLSMATPSSSPTPHHVTWIDTDGRKEDWFWSLTVSEDTPSISLSLLLSWALTTLSSVAPLYKAFNL